MVNVWFHPIVQTNRHHFTISNRTRGVLVALSISNVITEHQNTYLKFLSKYSVFIMDKNLALFNNKIIIKDFSKFSTKIFFYLIV